MAKKDGKEYEMVKMKTATETDAGVNRGLNTLMRINLNVKKGELVAVIGSVGSGKSSFLSTLLGIKHYISFLIKFYSIVLIIGELHLTNGSVRVVGSVAFADQRPWVLNATVRDNILFGKPYDEKKFDMAVHVCSLEDDIKVLPG